MNPLFQEILDASFKPVSKYAKADPLCFFCDHVVDLGDSFTRIPTLESVTKGKPEAYAHELCAAEADEEIAADEDRGYELPEFANWKDDFYDAFGEELS
jgi:hypothetical protein